MDIRSQKIDLYRDVEGIPLHGESFDNMIRSLNKGELKYYQFYNTEFNTYEYGWQKYLLKYQYLNKKFSAKVLNKNYYDIETKFDPKEGPDPINTPFEVTSIALYNSLKNEVFIYYLRDKKHKLSDQEILKGIWDEYNVLSEDNPTYKIQDLKINFKSFWDESELLQEYFLLAKSLGPLVSMGFNSSLFDDPYTINRLIKLIGEDNAYKYISDFEVKKYGKYTYEFPDYIFVDMLKLYMPVDKGGRGMGKSLPRFKLDDIAEVELKINKLDLQGDFNEIYYNDPIRFATYNMLDTLLVYKIDAYKEFIEQLYFIAQYNNATLSGVIRGMSFIYDNRNSFYYVDTGRLVREKKLNKEFLIDL